jgi:CRISPR-associated endonuclease/helicase Cas3
MMDFDTFFQKATKEEDQPERQPFPYQHRFATSESLPQLIDVPTGAGKTATIVLGWLWRRRFADEETKRTTPRRLVYCLPMRVLVEQTRGAAEGWIKNLGLQDEVRVYVLMGGEAAEDWDVHPERDAILIGTQDMLLSRALNRGYGMSRYRWPMHFGLLNNDCLWVLDEIQLMGSGLATTTQLQAFREKLQVWGTVQTIWMSATLQRDWLATVDFKDKLPDLSCLKLGAGDREDKRLKERLQAKKPVQKTDASAEDTEKLAECILSEHQKRKGLTLVVINTVDRARKLYDAIRPAERKLLVTKRGKRSKVVNHVPPQSAPLTPLLLHSRFRPYERQMLSRKLTLADKALRGEPLSVLSDEEKAWIVQVQQEGLIVIATQVVEAGVDISAKTLFTELAPWASLVQRFGRCNRFGECEEAQVYWMDVPTGKSLAEPYEDEELEAARNVLEDLTDVGIVLLEKLPDDLKKQLLRYEPIHVVRRKDIVELFDTTPDLAGNDIDISRFIRDGHDLDVQVFWREMKEPSSPSPKNENGRAPRREELCSVPFYRFKKDFLETAKKKAYRWDFLERSWTQIDKEEMDNVFPGQVFLIPTDQGGYDPEIGWEPKCGCSVKPIVFIESESPQPLDSNDDDLPSQDYWQTIAAHTNAVVAETERSAAALGLNEELRAAIQTAARWHDRGKAHHVFQEAIHDGRTGEKERPELWRGKRDLAKAPSGSAKHGVEGFWKQGYNRKHFRHELATGLAMLQADLPPLAAYLAAAHHGKVRLSIRSLPDEKRPDEANKRFARGVWDGDTLAATDLGDGVVAPEVTLSLEPMELGIGQNGQPSWAEQILRLRDDPQLGLFKLAFLEAVLRAADWRASDTHQKREGGGNA